MHGNLEIRYGYQCPVCKELYDTERKAQLCLMTHEDIEIEPIHTLGSAFPIRIRVYLIQGGVKVKYGDYKLDSDGIIEVMK